MEYPTVGIGTLLARTGLRDEVPIKGELLDRRAAALAQHTIPTNTATFPLFDDGTHGDLHPGNGYWTTQLSGLRTVDDMYQLRFIFDFTVDSCTTRREATQSIFVEVGVDPKSSKVDIRDSHIFPDGTRRTSVHVQPVDRYGNLWGPRRAGPLTCGPASECRLDQQEVRDHGDGSYSFNVVTPPGVASVRVNAFNSMFDVPIPCDDCPRLTSVAIDPVRLPERSSAKGVVQLSGPAPKAGVGGALVYLTSSNPLAAAVPDTVTVPAGQRSMTFPITAQHVHDKPTQVTISASYGGQIRTGRLTVEPSKEGLVQGPPSPPTLNQHQH